MIDDGVIKFNCNWEKTPLTVAVPSSLKAWRDKMHQLKFIGEYEEVKIGYGNISVKTELGFLVSGTQTGNVYPISDNDFTLVTTYNIDSNEVLCKGLIKASSESLTHAAVYEADQSINAIIHIHNKALWDKLKDKMPTTNKEVPYGTPQMALEIKRLFNETNVLTQKVIVMAGHEEGIIAFGNNLEEAGEIVLNLNNL